MFVKEVSPRVLPSNWFNSVSVEVNVVPAASTEAVPDCIEARVVNSPSAISEVVTELAARCEASKGDPAISVLISLIVWSAVAAVSIPSSLV